MPEGIEKHDAWRQTRRATVHGSHWCRCGIPDSRELRRREGETKAGTREVRRDATSASQAHKHGALRQRERVKEDCLLTLLTVSRGRSHEYGLAESFPLSPSASRLSSSCASALTSGTDT